MRRLTSFLLALIFSISAVSVFAAEKTLLVLDASGSMWGQINGVPKIQIARDSLKSLLKDWPADRETGLVVYGHRRKGDCGDIETIIPPGPLDAARMQQTVDALVPKGKTPLSAAVKQAAEALKYTEEKATVILISDGVETCNMDPCALGAELEKLGVDFTAHVIGFDINNIEDQKGLRCLAETTGGDFIPAADAAELNEALEKTAKAPAPEPEPEAELPEVTLVADDSVTKGTAFEVRIEAAAEVDGRVYLYPVNGDKYAGYQRIQQSKNGDYKIARLYAPAQIGDYTLKFLTLNDREVTQRPLRVTEAKISLNAPEQTVSGGKAKVEIEAPPGIDGRVFLYADDKDKSIVYHRIQQSQTENYKPIIFQMPSTVGDYIFRFKTLTDELLAEKPVKVVAAEISLDAPEQAGSATEIQVRINAPASIEGRVFLYRKGKEKPITYHRIQHGSTDDYRPLTFRMPAQVGDYEFIFKTLRDEELAKRDIQLTKVEVTLDAPETAPMATAIKVSLNAQPGLDGRVYLFASGKDKPISYQRLSHDSQDRYRPVQLRLPARPGDYFIRFQSLRNEPLAERPITVLVADYGLMAPENAQKESIIEVTPTGPASMRGRIYLYKTGKEKPVTYRQVIEGRIDDYDPVRIKLPSVPGDYVLRLMTNDRELLAERPLQVID